FRWDSRRAIRSRNPELVAKSRHERAADRDVFPPSSIRRIERGQAFSNGKTLFCKRQRLGGLALSFEELSQVRQNVREIALPKRVGGIGLGQPSYHSQRVSVSCQSSGPVALIAEHVADSLVAHPEVALPNRVGGLELPHPAYHTQR